MGEVALPGEQVERFYRVGVLGLRALQDRGLGPERFGEASAARWRAFKGELTESHRLDLLLRDGAMAYPLAFAAREVFALPGLADDEPFGAHWSSPLPSRAGEVLRSALEAVPPGAEVPVRAVLEGLSELWRLTPAPPDAGDVAGIGPASRVVVAGGGALLAVVAHMEGRPDMDLADQVLLVTDHPGERQLFGIAAALLGSRMRPRCATSTAEVAQTRAAGFERVSQCVTSSDASAVAKAAAQRLLSGLTE